MMPSFPYGQTLTIIRPGAPGFGGDPGTPEAGRTVDGCVVWPGDTEENTDHADQVTADLTSMWPFDTDIVSTDLVVDPDWDGSGVRPLCTVVGSPSRYRHPRTGTNVLTVRLLRNAG